MSRTEQGATRTIASTAMLACVLWSVAATDATALPSRSANRAQRLCQAARPGRAECLGMRLVSKSLTTVQLQANAVRQAQESAGGATPHVTNKTVPGGFNPAQLHEAYGLPTETPAAATQTIALVDAYNDPTAEADLGVYSKTFGLPACTRANGCLRILGQSGKASPLPTKNGEWASEISLDLQMAHAICQTCKLMLVEASSERWIDFGTAENAAVSAGATVVSNSYGGPEAGDYSSLNAAFEHSGVVITVSTGDCGYINSACPRTQAANFPSTSPSVVAVGGTSLTGSGSGWTSTAWNDGGSGCSGSFGAQSWQTSVTSFPLTGCGSRRADADVSAVGDPYTGLDVYDSTPAGSGDPTGWGVWGGTSASSPIVAAEFALAGGARGVGLPARTLYAHLGEGSALYDVTKGSNGSCGGASVCAARTGYDGPTGVGSPVGLSAFAVSGTPANSSLPAVSGTSQQGQTLTASTGEWSGSPTVYAYQWERCDTSGATCFPLAGATAATLLLHSTAVGSTIRVVVTASNGTGAGTAVASAATGTVASNVPTITGFTPATGATGTPVTITGTAFAGATAVHFGALSATFTTLSSTQIEAVVPNGAVVAAVSVTTPVKTATGTGRFTPSLSVTGSTPGRAGVGTTVTIKGLGFTPSSTVSFNGTHASSVTYVSATSLHAVVPPGATTGPISVTNGGAVSATVSAPINFAVS
jgi:hypothetical protein